MKTKFLRLWHVAIWRLVRVAHRADFAWFLPFIAKLPLPIAYALSGLRGRVNAVTGRDWRSVALGFRHIRRQSLAGYQLLPGNASDDELAAWRNQRFVVEARDEFEARLIANNRVSALSCTFMPPGMETVCQQRERGLLLLTPHFDSFFLGVAFLARSGAKVNLMSSTVTHDPRVNRAVKGHFTKKYRGLEQHLNGGQVLDMEAGLRPFYRMLEHRETLVVLGDAPVLPNGVSMAVDFLGAQRLMAGGALRMAQRTGSDLGGYVCRHLGQGRYELELCPIGPANDKAQQTLDKAAEEGKYTFLLFYKQNDELTKAMAATLNGGLASKTEQAVVASAQVGIPAEQALVTKYDVSRAPMPMTVVIAPNGALTGIFSQKVTVEKLSEAFVTPTMMLTMKSLQAGKLVVVTVQGSAKGAAPVALKDFQSDPHFKDRLVAISMQAADPLEGKFLGQMQLDPKTKSTHTVLLAPPGVLVGKFDAATSKDEIAAALAKAGKCCDDPNCKHHQHAPAPTSTAPRTATQPGQGGKK